MKGFGSVQNGLERHMSTLSKLAAVLCLALALAALASMGGDWMLPGPAQAYTIPSPTPTSTATPTPVVCGPWACPRQGYPDYAPHGPPDFDMRQTGWQASLASMQDASWTHSGPAAAGDAVWYFDSEAEYVLGRKYDLVTSYGVWSDHDPQNVPPFVSDLASEVQTSSEGTSVESYISKRGLAHEFTIYEVKGPSGDWMADESQIHEVVLILLGFWQQNNGQWVRVGGHWVAACCVEPFTRYVDFSDPFFDRAAAGYPGEAFGSPPTVPTVYNDAANVSFDRYNFGDTPVPGARWVPWDYGRSEVASVVANSLGQNFAADLEQYRGSYVAGPHVHVAADYAVVFRCVGCYQAPTPTPTATYTLTPTPTVTPTEIRYNIILPVIMKEPPLP